MQALHYGWSSRLIRRKAYFHSIGRIFSLRSLSLFFAPPGPPCSLSLKRGTYRCFTAETLLGKPASSRASGRKKLDWSHHRPSNSSLRLYKMPMIAIGTFLGQQCPKFAILPLHPPMKSLCLRNQHQLLAWNSQWICYAQTFKWVRFFRRMNLRLPQLWQSACASLKHLKLMFLGWICSLEFSLLGLPLANFRWLGQNILYQFNYNNES